MYFRKFSCVAFSVSLIFAFGALMKESSAANAEGIWATTTRCVKGCAGVCVGVGAGIPVQASRSVFSESHRMIQILRNDFGDQPSIDDTILARIIGIPYGAVSGVVLGTIHGARDGVNIGFDKPFSKESIGL